MQYSIFHQLVKFLNEISQYDYWELVPRETPLPYGSFGKSRFSDYSTFKDTDVHIFQQEIFFFADGRFRKLAFDEVQNFERKIYDLDLEGFNILRIEFSSEVDEHLEGEQYALINLELNLVKE
jgi:hypothetical protein